MENFYSEGLRWQCRRCSYCCRHESGYVFLSQNDLKALAKRFEVTEARFIEIYCRWAALNGSELLSLKEKSNNDCFFWKDGCSVYEDRPSQCRTYPFWEGFLTDEKTWLEAVSSCPGAGAGNTVSAEYIESCVKEEREESPISRPRRPYAKRGT